MTRTFSQQKQYMTCVLDKLYFMVNKHVLRRQRIKEILLKTVNCGDEQVLTRAIYISLLSISFRHVLFIFETDLAILVCLSRQVTVTENNEADKVCATKWNKPKLRFFCCFLFINAAVHVLLHLTLSRNRRALLIRSVFFIFPFRFTLCYAWTLTSTSYLWPCCSPFSSSMWCACYLPTETSIQKNRCVNQYRKIIPIGLPSQFHRKERFQT